MVHRPGIATAHLAPGVRDFRADDRDAVYAYASDPEVTRFMFYGPGPAETRSTLANPRHTDQIPRMTWELAIVLQGQDRPIGACDLTLWRTSARVTLATSWGVKPGGTGSPPKWRSQAGRGGFEHWASPGSSRLRHQPHRLSPCA